MTAKKDETAVATAATGNASVPAYMQKFMQNSQADAASMATASTSVPRLSFRGKRFRWTENGEEELVKNLTVDVIILGVEPDAGHFIKTYYDKPYNPGDTDPPTCSSSDGIRPDAWVSDPQADYCSKCAKNVFGSATSRSGGKSKACQDGKRLWVAKPDVPKKFYGLNCPVTSLKNLSEYGKYIGNNKYPLGLVITTLGMDDESEFPKLTFTHNGFVEEVHADAVIAINAERPWRLDFGDRPMLPDHSVGATSGGGAPQPSADTTAQTGAKPDAAKVEDVVGSW